MKKQLILTFSLIICCLIVSDSIEAKAGQKNSPFEYETKSLGNGTCRITEIRITEDKGISVLKVPDTINGETVVSIGPGMIHEKNEDAILQNVFLLSTYVDGGDPYKSLKYWQYKLRSWYYKPSHDKQKIRAMKIKKIILPDCITEIKEDCFAMLKGLKKINLPKNLTTIGEDAFTNSGLKKVEVAKDNKYFAVHKRCLYKKKKGKLLLIFGKGSTLTLSKKVKMMDRNLMFTKYKIKKLVIPQKIRWPKSWKKPYFKNIKIYYCGKELR